MVGIRKVQVCDRLVGILQHPADAPTIPLGLTLAKVDKVLFMRLSALPLIIGPISAAMFAPDFMPASPHSGAARSRPPAYPSRASPGPSRLRPAPGK